MYQESGDKGQRFASVKRKLNFDEDVVGMTVYEQGIAKYGSKDNNPFLKLLDSGESVPKFEHHESYRRDGSQIASGMIVDTV